MSGFDRMGLHPGILKALTQMGFTSPTPIQEKAIPPALMGQDILGSAQTGTGKTAAFGIPMVQYLLLNPSRHALVLTPTRELAMQVAEVKRQLTASTPGISTALLIGGSDMQKQIAELRNRPRIVVGTPGRVIDHLEQGTLFLGTTEFLVLDETDRMLDMGFGIQLAKIRKFLKAGRQTLLFSATLPPNIKELAANYLKEPVRISVGGNAQPVEHIRQEVVRVNEAREKYNALLTELRKREGSIIVFTRTKVGADRLAQQLERSGQHARAIHGDLSQAQRDMALEDFRASGFRVLVATDIASRGLDIPHVAHVVNYELPQAPEDYIHRIGRTGRAGAEGQAVCLLTPEDNEQWRIINRMIDMGASRDNGVDAPPPAIPNASHKNRKFRPPRNRHYDGEKIEEKAKKRRRRRSPSSGDKSNPSAS